MIIKCGQCQKNFHTQHRLTDLFDAVHKGIKKYECDKCQKQFGFIENLKKHMHKCS